MPHRNLSHADTPRETMPEHKGHVCTSRLTSLFFRVNAKTYTYAELEMCIVNMKVSQTGCTYGAPFWMQLSAEWALGAAKQSI